jgi:hypothetical protein
MMRLQFYYNSDRSSSVIHSTEFPDGNITFTKQYNSNVSDLDNRSVGWAMVVYATKKSKSKGKSQILKSCLGNFECPVSDCQYHLRPHLPRERRKGAVSTLVTGTACPHHNKTLQHTLCPASLKVIQVGSVITFTHRGFHTHRRPHPIRPDAGSKEKFGDLVRTASEVRPKSLQIGTSTREPLRNIHPVYLNLDRTAYHRSKILKKSSTTSSLGHAANFEKNLGIKIIVSSSLSDVDGHVSLQTSFLKERLCACQSSLQTDSIEGFVID